MKVLIFGRCNKNDDCYTSTLLKISDKKGVLAAGKDAHTVLFDSNIEIQMIITEGRIVYNSQSKNRAE